MGRIHFCFIADCAVFNIAVRTYYAVLSDFGAAFYYGSGQNFCAGSNFCRRCDYNSVRAGKLNARCTKLFENNGAGGGVQRQKAFRIFRTHIKLLLSGNKCARNGSHAGDNLQRIWNKCLSVLILRVRFFKKLRQKYAFYPERTVCKFLDKSRSSAGGKNSHIMVIFNMVAQCALYGSLIHKRSLRTKHNNVFFFSLFYPFACGKDRVTLLGRMYKHGRIAGTLFQSVLSLVSYIASVGNIKCVKRSIYPFGNRAEQQLAHSGGTAIVQESAAAGINNGSSILHNITSVLFMKYYIYIMPISLIFCK